MTWIEIASLPLAAGLFAVFGYVLYRIFKLVLGILVDRAIKPIETVMQVTATAITESTKTQIDTVNNHLEHSARADEKLADAVLELAKKIEG